MRTEAWLSLYDYVGIFSPREQLRSGLDRLLVQGTLELLLAIYRRRRLMPMIGENR